MSNFKFMLSYKAWVFEGDENQEFRALELVDGSYLVSWIADDKKQKEVFYSAKEVFFEIAEGYWVVIEDEK